MGVQDLAKAYKAWPKWARIAAPVAAGVVLIGAVGSAGGDSSDGDTTSTTAAVEFVEISDATALAMGAAEDAGLTETEASSLVEDTCDAASDSDGADALAEQLVSLEVAEADLRPLLNGLGDAAEAFCPDAVAEAPGLLNDTYTVGVALLRAATTTTAAPTTTTTTTTVPPTTAAPTTTAPPPPPTTTPTATPSSDVYYANCDAVRAAGAAPLYAGQPGYRSGLDRDGDGMACE